jgi:hypothetical protein
VDVSGHRALAVRGEIAPATMAVLMASADPADVRETLTPVGFLAPLEDGLFAIGRVGPWTIAWDAISWIDDSAERDVEQRRKALADLSRGGAVLHWLTESTSGTDGFDWFVDGSLVRGWWLVEGEAVDRVGAAIAAEPDAGLDAMPSAEVDEWVIAGVVESLVAPWDVLIGAEYRLVTTH